MTLLPCGCPEGGCCSECCPDQGDPDAAYSAFIAYREAVESWESR